MANHCAACHNGFGGDTCQTPVAAWHKILDNAAYWGVAPGQKYTPLVSGTFTKFKAVHRSGCVGCSTSYAAKDAWQCCGDSYSSFELYKNDKEWIAKQPNWHSLPSGCTRGSGATDDIVC